MRWLSFGAAGLMLMVSAEAVAQAPPAGDIAAGRKIAVHTCDACHVVAPDQDLPPLPNYGPSFVEIASKPGTTLDGLRTYLAKPHPLNRMPFAALTPAQIVDVSAYVMSLRQRR